MSLILPNSSRRDFLRATAPGGAALATPGVFAEMLATPRQVEGPFYPDKLPLDTDNDLIVLNDALTPAVGEITHLTGRVTNLSGEPIRNAVVEIWQCDGNGAYIHSKSGNKSKSDGNFQGFGRFLTGSKGEYYFRTIKPVPYPGRTPHIHFRVEKASRRLLTTQCYIKGHRQNDGDRVMRSTPSATGFDLLMVDWNKMENSRLNEHSANFDIVIGATPEDA